MTFIVESREDLFADWLDRCKALLPSISRAKGSDLWVLGRIVSGATWTILARLLAFDKNALPDTAVGDALTRWGNVFNFPAKGASGSTGTSALLVTGTTAGVSIPAGTLFTDSSGQTYQVTTVGAVIGVSGNVTVDIAAVSTGASTNLVSGDVLTFVTPLSGPPNNVAATATLVANLANGADTEAPEAYRVRLLAHIGAPPQGGTVADYKSWAESVAGVASAYIYTGRRGLGSIDVAVLGNGTGAERRITNLTPIQTYLNSVKPLGADVKVVDTVAQAPIIKIYTEIDTTTSQWDWQDQAVGYFITTSLQSASTITITAGATGIAVGDRLTVRGEQATITNIAGAVLTLAFQPDRNGNPVTWFSFTPTGGVDVILAGGDVVTPVRNAIMDLFGKLGPARGNYAAFYWPDNVLLSDIIATVTSIVGYGHTVQVQTLSGNNPIDPGVLDPYSILPIPFLVPGQIQVLDYSQL